MVFSCGMHAPRSAKRSQASGKTSLCQISSYSAWKRRSSLRLAAMYSRRWSFRTFSMGLLGLATMPSRLPPYTGTTKAGSLSSSRLLDGRLRYYEPLGLPPGTIPLRHRLIGTACTRRGPPGRVSPVPYQAVWACPPPYPVGVLHPSGSGGCSLLPSSWHERLGHPSPFGFLCHEAARFTFRLGPPTCLPPGNLKVTEGLSTSRSGEQLSLLARDLLRGAPALTATGLSPASLIQHNSTFVESVRTHHGGIVTDGRGQRARGVPLALPVLEL